MSSRILTYSSTFLSATFVFIDFGYLPAAAVLAAPIIRRICKSKKPGQPGPTVPVSFPCILALRGGYTPCFSIGGFIPFGKRTRISVEF